MMPQRIEKRTPKASKGRGPTKFPGITQDAKALGVNRATLWKMLHNKPGFGDLHRLRERYNQLKQQQREENSRRGQDGQGV